MERSRWKTVILLLIWLMIAGGFIYWNQTVWQAGPDDIRNWLLSVGLWAPALYIVIYTLRPLLLFPASILSLAGGFAFGPLWGMIWTIVGATGSATVAFAVSRWFGRSLTGTYATEQSRWYRLQKGFEQRGFTYVLLMRLIPLFPYDLVSYAAGLSRIPLRTYLVATVIGIVPGTFAFNFLGASFATGDWRSIAIAAVVFIAAILVPLLLKNRFEKGERQ
jgi:uncharacterized membrane protein YdjX (TVP38/TMEM64 family)